MDRCLVGGEIVQNEQLSPHHLGKLLVGRDLQEIRLHAEKLPGKQRIVHAAKITPVLP